MKRFYHQHAIEHLKKHDQMLFLMGPRQVGKTTIAKTLLQEWGNGLYLNWDNLKHRALILEGPDIIAAELGLEEFIDDPPLLIIDEIQKYSHWRNYIKGFYDTYKGLVKILITGSSKLDLFIKGGDSLMGRYFIFRIHPFSIGEIVGQKFHQKEFSDTPKSISTNKFANLLRFGGFPDPFLKADKFFYNRWKKLRNKQIFKEDIRDLTKVHEITGIELLASLLQQQTGQLTTYSSLAKKIGVTDKTIKEWIEILKSLYFFYEIRPWFRNLSKSLVKQPKYFLWDWSLIQDSGALAENFVASHLLKSVHFWNDLGLGDYDLYFLRDSQKREVDFLITHEEKPWILVEVKNGLKRITKNLNYFYDALEVEFAFQVSFGKKEIKKNCFLAKRPSIVPAKTFLSQLF